MAATEHPPVRCAVSTNLSTKAAIQEVLQDCHANLASFTFVFFSPRHCANTVATSLYETCKEKAIAGTTAGEIISGEFLHGSIVAMSFFGPVAKASATIVRDISNLPLESLRDIDDQLARSLGYPCAESLDDMKHRWIIFVDGTSGYEEVFTPSFARHARPLPMVGGSFGDAENFGQALLIHDGKVLEDAAAVVLLEYNRPSVPIFHTHLTFTDTWLTVTEVSDRGRVIRSLDHQPARDAYAAALHMHPDEVDSAVIGVHPLGYRFRGAPFPCSIMTARSDGSLTMAYSVQVDDRLNILKQDDLLPSMTGALEAAVGQLGTHPIAGLFFHCLGLYFDARRRGCLTELAQILGITDICGFHSYGEQFEGMHMNHSLTGLLFG